MPGSLGKAGKLVGGFIGSKLAPSQPAFSFFPRINTPSFSLEVGNRGKVNLARTAFPQRFPDVLKKLSELQAEVKPGFGSFTKAAVEAIQRAKGDALGTARDQLARRRVLGASFANAQLAAIERDFGVKEAEKRTEALLREIDQTFKIIDQEFKVKAANFEAEFKELGIASDVAGLMTRVLSDQAILDKKVAVQAAIGTGKFGADVGSLIGGVDFGDVFGGAGGSTALPGDATFAKILESGTFT